MYSCINQQSLFIYFLMCLSIYLLDISQLMNLYGSTLIFQGLCDFFAKPNILTCLDLSSTECPLDLVTTFYYFIINPADQLMHVYHFAWQNTVEKTTTTKQIMTKRNGKNRPIPKTKQTRNKQQKQINTGKSFGRRWSI